MSDSCRVEVTGLMLSVMPCFTSVAGEDLGKANFITTHAHCTAVC